MARQYNWTNRQKLDKLVEALQDKALTFYSNLAPDVHDDYDQVNRKFNARFGPKEPPQTVRNQLKVVKQKADEPLEGFAEQCQSLANDAWAEDNQDMADRSAMDAFLHGVLDTESAYSAMDKNPATMDEALDLVKQVLHNWKALFGAQAKTIRNVSFMGENEGVEERHIHVVKASSLVPAPVEEKIHKLEKSMGETKGQLDKIDIVGDPHGQAFQSQQHHLDAINAMRLVIL